MKHAIDIVFVILHFNTFNETLNCIDSITRNFGNCSYKIIVVDNASPNGTGRELNNKYCQSDEVEIILSSQNVGFARGNNIGILKAKEYSPRFVCCTNSDTFFEQIDFFEQLDLEYKNSKAALIGPMIIRKNGDIQKYNNYIKSIEEYKKECDVLSNGLSILSTIKKFIALIPGAIYIRDKIYRWNGESYPGCYLKRKENVILHGCCLIFTQEFFDYYSGFYDKTFMYKEEEILYIMVRDVQMKTVYCPDIKVRHLEDASTNTLFGKKAEKEDFRRKMKKESTEVLIDFLKDSNYLKMDARNKV